MDVRGEVVSERMQAGCFVSGARSRTRVAGRDILDSGRLVFVVHMKSGLAKA